MVLVQSYPVAVLMCVVTMLCWGSWANTQKLATRAWPFQLFYFDYGIGVFLLSLLLAFTMGSTGEGGRNFLVDLKQAAPGALGSALIGGIIFNLSNILLVAAIDIAGMAVAFPVGVGLALALGVITTYVKAVSKGMSGGNVMLLGLGVACVVCAIIVDAIAYKRLSSTERKTPMKGLVLSIVAGVLMGFFYQFVVDSMTPDFANPAAGKLTPYTAVVIFSLGLLLSNFIWNSIVMVKPFAGPPVAFSDYFSKGTPGVHLTGVLGGMIWNTGMSFSIIASGAAGPALSYGLGQGATLVAAIWGVFIWREFRQAPKGTGKLLALMFVFYVVGLALLIAAK